MSLLSDILFIECDLDSEEALEVFFRSTGIEEHSTIRRIVGDEGYAEAYYDKFCVSAIRVEDASSYHATLGMTPMIMYDFEPLTAERSYRDIVLKSVLYWIETSEYNLAWLLYEAFPVLERRNGNLILNRAYPYIAGEEPFWTADRLKLLPKPYAWEDFPIV